MFLLGTAVCFRVERFTPAVARAPGWRFCVGLHTHPTNTGEPFSESTTGLDHISFLVSGHAELEAWEARLGELGVEHSSITDRDGYAVLVFRDPDNIQLEFITLG